MFDEPLAFLSLIATLVLLFVSLRAANAAKQSADLAAREFRLRSRPVITVEWQHTPSEPDGAVYLSARIAEVAGVATALRSIEASATPVDPATPANTISLEPDAVLRGDAATFTVFLKIVVPRWTLIHAPPPAMRDLNVVPVARLDVRVVVALAEEDADVETWQANETLHYGARAQSFVAPTQVHVRRVSGRAHAPRSRVLAPVLRAWERWWDRVQ